MKWRRVAVVVLIFFFKSSGNSGLRKKKVELLKAAPPLQGAIRRYRLHMQGESCIEQGVKG
jgi:hypothetical protein